MSKATGTTEYALQESKKASCCGGAHAEDQKAQPAQKKLAIPTGDHKREHAHHSDGGSCCCGSGKASK